MRHFSTVTHVLPHLLAWGFILLFLNAGVFQWQWSGYSSETGTLLIPSLYGSAFNALIFYGHARWLYPKKKEGTLIGTYWLWVVVLLAIPSLAEGILDFFYSKHLGLIPEAFQRLPAGAQIVGYAIDCSMVHLVYWLFSFVYIRLRQNHRMEEQQKILSQEKLTTELQYLKAQINPHVLFNGINSVYHLIDESPERAKHTLLTFSNLLRYQLYECRQDLVPLDKELSHLSDYITLEETRKGEDAVVAWEVQEDPQPAQIAPMILQPFIENAFKHLSHHEVREQNRLQLFLAVDQGVLSMNVENTVSSDAKQPSEDSGVGLANVKRRLQLIYPDRHQLFISHPPGVFRVHLLVTL